MSLKLHQLLAVEKTIKADAAKALTDLYHRIDKGSLLSGIARSYRPLTDDGERLPPESTLLQLRVEQEIPPVLATLVTLYDTMLRKEHANLRAKADVVIDGTVILSDVPVCALLFLEKQTTDLKAFIQRLPTLDPSETWAHDPAQNCWATAPNETARTKKVPVVLTRAQATDKHPAQTELVHEDRVVGYWSTTKFSGAISAERKATLIARIGKLSAAIKVAREGANAVPVGEQKMGEVILNYLFGA